LTLLARFLRTQNVLEVPLDCRGRDGSSCFVDAPHRGCQARDDLLGFRSGRTGHHLRPGGVETVETGSHATELCHRLIEQFEHPS
jgi:hypothetical protein